MPMSPTEKHFENNREQEMAMKLIRFNWRFFLVSNKPKMRSTGNHLAKGPFFQFEHASQDLKSPPNSSHKLDIFLFNYVL